MFFSSDVEKKQQTLSYNCFYLQSWCHHSRSDLLMVTLMANDGLNQLTSALKHEWLDDLKTRSLTETFSGIVSEYLPAHYYKYVIRK